MKTNTIIKGNALEELKKLPDESIDLIITSPPYYGLRNYQVEGQIGLEETFEEYLEKMLKITAELKRVLKKTGQMWWNHGDCYGGMQGKYNGYPDQKLKKGEQLPNFKKLKAGWEGKENIKTSTLTNPEYNYKRGRAGNQKCLLMQPERLAIKMIDEQGWILRNKIKWTKQVLIKKENKTIGSVMPTSVKDRFNESGEEFYFFVKSKKYYSNLDAVRIPNQVLGVTDFRAEGFVRSAELYYNSKYRNVEGQGKIDGASRFNLRVRDAERKAGQPGYKATKEEIERYKRYGSPRARAERRRDKTLIDPNAKGLRQAPEPGEPNAFHPLGKNIPTIWQINSEPHNFRKELGVDVDHFAVFPEALVEIPIKFGCPPNGIVLDPFFGSGTTGLVALKQGKRFIGIELNPEYIKIAKKRLRPYLEQTKL